jgi:hypothetical protein
MFRSFLKKTAEKTRNHRNTGVHLALALLIAAAVLLEVVLKILGEKACRASTMFAPGERSIKLATCNFVGVEGMPNTKRGSSRK